MLRLIVIVAALLLAQASAAAETPSLAHLKSFIERVQSMRADFRQVQIDDSKERREESHGQMMFLRPGRFRWDYHKPYERSVVADGERLWLYEADLAQVTVRPLADGLGETPAALLTGGGDILARFEPVQSWTAENIAWVRLRPRAADSDFESVAVGFAGEQLVQIEINDRLGQQTQVYFTAISVNPHLDEQGFRFEVPEGADVIREGEL